MLSKKIHQGRNVKRFREMLGIKQDALAFDLGEDWNQKKISEALKIPVEAFQNFDEEQAVNIIANTFHDSAAYAYTANFKPTFHPLDQVIKLHEEKIALYERMLKEKDEMMAKLEEFISKDK